MLDPCPRRPNRRPWAFAAALLLVPTLACGTESAPAGSALTLPLHAFGGRPVVAVTINDRGPYDFILDSGAAITLIDSTLAEELGLAVSGTMESGSPLGPPATFQVTHLDKVGVGTLDVGGQKALLYDFASFLGSGGAPRGVLSYLAFDGYLIVQDYPRGELRFERGSLPDKGDNVFPLGGEDRLAEIGVTIAGQQARLHVDTGSPGGITLPLSMAATLPLVAPPVVRGRGKTVNGSFDIYSATLDGVVAIGSLRLERPELHFIEGAPVGNIGNGFLANYVVTLDPAGHRMRLEAPGAADGPTRVVRSGGATKRYGIRFPGIGGARLEVVGVDAGSPGEEAGVKEGDVIVGMNGKPVAEMSQAERIEALRGSPLTLEIRSGERAWTCTMSLE